MNELRTTPTPREEASRRWSIGLCLGLIGLCLVWELFFIGSWGWALKVLPLLPALPGLWRYRMYTYRWLSLLVWVYVFEGAVHAASSTGAQRWLGGVEVLLAIGLFAACSAHIRWRLAQAKMA
ncbi:MAG: DUF2069 domain-containing protein [Inhella sp.]